ncbi:MAG: Cna B-type domain-containing protein, partial [Clostridia bacterium]|nr:Cna B-type domain-containing protein [Clostridia bacterium]
MKKRLRQILSLLCVLALAFGCVTTAALAESTEPQEDYHVIGIEWSDDNNADNTRPTEIKAYYGDKEITLSEANNWTGEILSVPDSRGWTLGFNTAGYDSPVQVSNKDGITIYRISKSTVPTAPVTAWVEWEDADNSRKTRPKSVQLILEGNGEPVGEPQTVNTPAKSATWDNMPANGIKYTVKQMDSLSAYTTDCNGLTVTNTLKTGTLNLKVSLDAPEGADLSGLKLAIDGPDPLLKKTLTYADVKGGTVSLGPVLEGAYLVRDTNADTLVEGYVMDPANSKVADAVYVKNGENPTLEFKYAWKLPEPLDEEAEEDYDPLANTGNLTFEILGPDARTKPMT